MTAAAVMSADLRWMAQALQQARKGRYTTSPNPNVGCVIVKNNQLLASGYHQRAGEPHAERNALNQLLSSQTQDATCYVTLEPCSHTGRTAPCADALIAANIKRVVIAMQDPNPQVAGNGIARLKAADIDVVCGVMEAPARALNAGFVKRFTQGLPRVRVKLAISLDGRIAMASGESFWITGTEAREDVQRLRAQSCAIITGMGTYQADNPSLTVRADEWQQASYPLLPVRQPLRVLVSSRGNIDTSDKLFNQQAPTLVATASLAAAEKLQQQGIDAQAFAKTRQVDLRALLHALADRGCNDVLIEAGATLSAAFIEQGLADELVVYQAPVLLGQTAKPALALNIDTMADKRQLTLEDERRIGQDWRYTFSFDA